MAKIKSAKIKSAKIKSAKIKSPWKPKQAIAVPAIAAQEPTVSAKQPLEASRTVWEWALAARDYYPFQNLSVNDRKRIRDFRPYAEPTQSDRAWYLGVLSRELTRD